MDKRITIGQRRNLLLRYKMVMEEVDKHDLRDIAITRLHRKYIYPKFHISRDTLYRIFNTDIDSELTKLDEEEKNLQVVDTQQSLF